MKIIDSVWITSLSLIGCIGIVIGEDEETGKRKAYVGLGYGLSEQANAEKIARDGGKLTAEMAARIADLLSEGKQQV